MAHGQHRAPIDIKTLKGELHAREPLYSNSAVIAWCSQSTGAQNILFWLTVIHSMSQYFTAFNFYDVFFHLELLLRYCSPFWPSKSL